MEYKAIFPSEIIEAKEGIINKPIRIIKITGDRITQTNNILPINDHNKIINSTHNRISSQIINSHSHNSRMQIEPTNKLIKTNNKATINSHNSNLIERIHKLIRINKT